MVSMATAPPRLFLVAQKFIREIKPKLDSPYFRWSCKNPWGTPFYTDIDLDTWWMIELVHYQLYDLSQARRQKILEENREMSTPSGISLISGFDNSDSSMQDAILAALITDVIYKIIHPESDANVEMQMALAAPDQGRIWQPR